MFAVAVYRRLGFVDKAFRKIEENKGGFVQSRRLGDNTKVYYGDLFGGMLRQFFKGFRSCKSIYYILQNNDRWLPVWKVPEYPRQSV